MNLEINKISNKFYGIQSMRGIAALSVMFFHFRWSLNNAQAGLGHTLFGWGAIGVDLFFLISGCVIVISLERLLASNVSVFNFILHRIKRIFPAYYFFVLVFFLLGGAMSTFHYADKTSSLIASLFFYPSYLINAPFYLDDNGLLGVRWTLNYEVGFYILCFISILLIRNVKAAILSLPIILLVVPLLIGLTPKLDVSGYQTNYRYLNLIINPIMWLFFAGMLIGHYRNFLLAIPVVFSRTSLLISSTFTLWCVISGFGVAHGINQSGLFLIPLLVTIVMNEDLFEKFSPKILLWFGELSYTLYLSHTLMNNVLGKRLAGTIFEHGVIRFFTSIIVAVVISFLVNKYIERRFYRKQIAS